MELDKSSPAFRQNRWLLTFDDARLEDEFRQHHVAVDIRRTRISILMGALAFLCFGLVILYFTGEFTASANILVFGATSSLLLFLALSYHPLALRHAQLHSFLGTQTITWIMCLAMAAAPSGSASSFAYVAALVILTFNYFLLHMSFRTAIVSGILISATFLAFSYGFSMEAVRAGAYNLAFFYHRPESPDLALFSYQVGAVVVFNALCWIIARETEAKERAAFVSLKIIEDQRRVVEFERARSERLLLNILPRPIADRLKASPEAIADEHAEVTVLFADIVNFTVTSARLKPADLVAALNALFTRFDQIMAERGIERIKTIGDAYMAVAGVPIARPDHTEVILDAALAMQEAALDFRFPDGSPVTLRIGVHRGAAVSGVVGTQRFAYDLWGDTVNTASRMESHGIPGQVQVSDETRRYAGNRFRFGSPRTIEVKGKGPMQVWTLEALVASAGG